ncbi:hypothetical protein ACFY94_25900 [Streptomyces griseorubiginosus]|uniref:hypothetical protein n=1 Tax=Streptomyces griseorubiginosus TaxID=67304 RepID=UPI0036E959F6
MLIEHMLPTREQLAGTAGAAYAGRPLAHALDDLYQLVGEDRTVADLCALAERGAVAWDAPRLAAAARLAAARPEQ